MGEIRFFQFPLILLKGVHEDFEEGMQDIIRYAIVDFALKQDVSDWDVARQLAYSAIRGGGLNVADGLKAYMPELEGDDFATAICNDALDDDTIASIIGYMKESRERYSQAVMNCQLNKVDGFFGISGPESHWRLESYLSIKKKVDEHEQKHKPEPRPTISKELFFDMMKQGDADQFCMYIAIRSQEGKKTYTATNRPTIAGRMTGAKTQKVLQSDAFIQKLYEGYNNRYRFDKIFNQLFKRNLIKSVLRQKYWSRFFVSTKLTPSELGSTIKSKHEKRNIQRKIDEAVKAYEQVNTTS